MKVAFISDLHYDVDRKKLLYEDDYIRAFVELGLELEFEMLVIGGDISNHYKTTFKFVENLEKALGIPVYFIPGNHDYWQGKKEKKTSWDIHKRMQQHKQSLLLQPVRLSNTHTLVGHCAWYNYAYHSDEYSKEEIKRGKLGLATWQDKKRIDWGMSDPEVSKIFARELEEDIEKAAKYTKEFVLVSHIVTWKNFLVPMPHRYFDYFNAYIATDDLDYLYQKYNISHSFMGHVHFRAEDIDEKGTKYYVNCLGYSHQWRKSTKTQKLIDHIRHALVVIDF